MSPYILNGVMTYNFLFLSQHNVICAVRGQQRQLVIDDIFRNPNACVNRYIVILQRNYLVRIVTKRAARRVIVIRSEVISFYLSETRYCFIQVAHGIMENNINSNIVGADVLGRDIDFAYLDPESVHIRHLHFKHTEAIQFNLLLQILTK